MKELCPWDNRRQGPLESLRKDVVLCPLTLLDEISSDGLKGPTGGVWT